MQSSPQTHRARVRSRARYLHRSQTPPLPARPRRGRRRRRGRCRAPLAGACGRSARRASRHRRRAIARPSTCATTTRHDANLRRRRTMLLTRQVRQRRRSRSASSPPRRGPLPTMDRRTFLKRSGLVAGAGAFASQLPYGAIGKAERGEEGDATKVEVKRTVCTHCSVGCAVDATVENGVWTRQEPVFDSPLNLGAHCAKGASVREHGMHEHSHRLKTPMKLVNGKWQKISLGPGDQRGRRQAARDHEGVGSRRGVLGRQLEAQQRAVVPDAQVRVVLRHQQLRSPGAHLPLDDGRRRSQHLGLRRDDQLVQRHAEHQVRAVHRQQRGRGAPGVDAAHAACEGKRREDDRRRSALHAHRGQGRRVRAHPLRHRHPVPVRHAATTSSRTAGRTSSTSTTASTAWTRSRTT